MNQLQKISKVGFFGVIGNFFLMLLKFFSGIVFSSQAMISDAVNSFMDIFSSFMTLLGGKLATRPKDEDHPFGHGKAEFLFSLFVSLSMIFSAFLIFINSLKTIWNGHEVVFSYLLCFVCVITILIKFCLYFYARYVYLETKSLLVYSNMVDHRNDIIITCFTLLSILFSYYHIFILDSIVGVGISLWIGFSGFHIFLESYHILMDQAMDIDSANHLQVFISKQKGVLGITKFETVPTGNQYLVVLSILVDGNLTTLESHKIADRLKKKMLKQFPNVFSVTIHVNPLLDSKH